jgi:hypothetical protein
LEQPQVEQEETEGTEFEDFCASSLLSLFPPVQKIDLRILNIISSGL